MAAGFDDVDEYFELARRDLPGLFGASIDLVEIEQRTVTRRYTPQTTRIRIPGGTHVLQLYRPSLAFRPEETELQLVYGRALEELHQVPAAFARTASADVLTRAIAVRCARAVPAAATALEDIVRLVIEQATKTYEGIRIAVNVCVNLAVQNEGEPLSVFFDRPWAAMLGSGLTTSVAVSGGGAVTGLLNLEGPVDAASYAPERFLHVASWSASPGRVSLAATRSGEIYVFVEGQLLFAHRNSQWRGFPLSALAGSGWFHSAGGIPRASKRAALISLVDASTAHHGACLGIIRSSKVSEAVEKLVAISERWSNPANPRRRLFPGTNFASLSRRQRLEMLSMDGATLINPAGKILAAGAILTVGGGSTGGGRTAAAQAIGKFGVGMKVSQDGPVSAFSGPDNEVIFKMG